MTASRQSLVLQHLRHAAFAQDVGGRTDGELLGSFVARQDAAALEALVRRHAPMVLAVCRRVLAHEQDAEDAFQAAFLVFVRKAASIRGREQVGNWLYGVAYRTALKARGAAARRRAKERRAADMTSPQTESAAGWDDLLPLLDQELNRLPDKYRTPLVLCELEGRPRKEAARQLGVPEGTLSSRLATGRRMLAMRLARHAPSPSAGALAAALAHGTTLAGVPPPLLASTVKAVLMVAAGQAAAGVISVHVAALVEGVLKTMLLTKLAAITTLLALVAVVAVGAGATAYCAPAACPKPPEQASPNALPKGVAPEDKQEVKKEEPEWGEAVDGVQARLRPAKAAWDEGETPEFKLDLRNRGEKVHGACRVLNFCEIEWDGKWYEYGGSHDLDCKAYTLDPGKQIDEWVKASLDIPWVRPPDRILGEPLAIGSVVHERLHVAPGKHTLRIAFVFDVGPRPVSNAVEVEVGKESTWGGADGGVEARVRTAKAVWKASEAPTFSLDLRNQGTTTPDARRVPFDCQIEVDGTWYAFELPSGPYLAVGDLLEPGKQVNDWTTVSPGEHWRSLTDKRDRFSLPPGKHTIRIAYSLQGVTPKIRPVSGPVDIEVREDEGK